MSSRMVGIIGGLVMSMLVAGNGVSAHHSYLLSVQQLRAGIAKAPSKSGKGFILVDVRSAEEHAEGFIPGTDFNIDFREIKARHKELGASLTDHIVVYCRSGHRSNIAAEALADLGYTHVYNVSGSMNAWMEAGYPVDSGGR
ncbi:Rhodanese-like sulfurtransferase [Nitrospira sp. KM1]|uniref:rhodanese-like domain-containing protein n=1 Tax=Nitrospira sp. KM1 TaxID=1936990 RepID=UPI0013A73B59|nr:rhodanese-like domain-containing protein [Nitrospira sp. KM1]BCA55377.1 Rhodanese-like sulfurtransferase [Nitrospira sp. KM1]